VSYSQVDVNVEGMYFIVYLGLCDSAVSNWDYVI
jgi:hypothetical protein